jgi:galactokinase
MKVVRAGLQEKVTKTTRISDANVQSRFQAMFGGIPRVYRAPGRVNLIGEHTDYNEGFVLPVAIDYCCLAAIAPRDDRILAIHSEQFTETVEFDMDRALRPANAWSDYPAGVCWALLQEGFDVGGANISLSSDVPLGAGLSSSAAVEVSTGLALMSSNNFSIDRTRLSLNCQRAENDFVGARCGIMDQFVSCLGEEDHAILLDCRSLTHRAIRIPPGIRIVVCNTMVRHSVAAGEYNTRRAECEEAVRRFATLIPGVRSLRDVSRTQLEQYRGLLTTILYRRCRHVVSENDRVIQFATALEAANLDNMKNLMADSHASLRGDYEVSCKELDIMVEIASQQPAVCGARMTGGGFGGCTVNLVDAEHAAEFKSRMVEEYKAATGIMADVYICKASEGAAEVSHISSVRHGA